jgi:hypothetical protein
MITRCKFPAIGLQAAGVIARILRIPGTLACPGQAR